MLCASAIRTQSPVLPHVLLDCCVARRRLESSTTTETQRSTEVAQRKLKENVMDPHINDLTHEIIGGAIEVHRHLGPGLMESAYRLGLCRELFLRGIKFKQENWLGFDYKAC